MTQKGAEFSWGKEQQAAFEKIKQLMSEAGTLTHFDPDAHTTLVADASPYAQGAILTQFSEGKEKVIVYGHKSLSAVE